MIQAIENNYEAPSLYFEQRKQHATQEAIAAAQAAVQDCAICGNTGFRYVKSSKYPEGAMRQCSHDATVELQYADANGPTSATLPDAQNGPITDPNPDNEKRPAEDSASP